MIEDRGIHRPVLVELRGKLDEVARRRSPGEARIFRVGEHPVQCVAELVEHRDDVVEADERRLTGRRLRQVADVVDDRPCAEQLRLTDEVRHPGAAVLVVALEVVAIKERERLAVGVDHIEYAHVGLIDRDVLALLEGDAVELVRRIEHAVLEHVVELEVRLDLRIVQVVLRLANLLGVKIPVPRLEREAAVLSVDDRLDVLALARGAGRGERHESVHEIERVLRRFRHLVLELPGRVIGKPEQGRALRAQLREPRHDRARVVRIAVLGAVPGIVEDRASRRRARPERAEQRLLRRVLQRHEVALDVAPLRGLSRGGELRLAEAGERIRRVGVVYAPAILAASSFLMNVSERVDSSAFIFLSRSLSGGDKFAPACTNSS